MTWLKLLQNIIRKLSNFPWDSGLRHRRDKKKKSTEESHSIAFNVVQIEIKETNVQHLSYFFFWATDFVMKYKLKGGREKKGQKRLALLKKRTLFLRLKNHPFYICFWWHLINGQKYKGCSDDGGLHHYIQSTRLLKRLSWGIQLKVFWFYALKSVYSQENFLTGLVY